MIVRSIGLAAVGFVLATEALLVPSTVSLPGLSEESLHRHAQGWKSKAEDAFKALPIPHNVEGTFRNIHIPEDIRQKFKELYANGEFEHKGEELREIFEGAPKKFQELFEEAEEEFKETAHDLEETFKHAEEEALEQGNDFAEEVKHEADEVWNHLQNSVGESGVHQDEENAENEGITVTIVDLDNLPEDVDTSACPKDHSFQAMICRTRAFLASKFNQAKPYFKPHRRPCPKKLAEMAKANGGKIPIHGGPAKFWNKFHPGEKMPETLRPGHYFHVDEYDSHTVREKAAKILHSICHGIRRFVTGFLIPVLIGVAAGMAASIVGMIVGTTIAWLYIKLVRGGKRGNAGAIVLDDEIVVGEEKDGLLLVRSDEEDAPPVYVEKE